MFYRLTRSMVGVGFALVTAVIVAAPASAAMPAASASVAVPHMVADAGVDQDSAWANHGKNSNQGKHVGPKGDCDKDSDRRSDCKNPSPIPPAPTPTPVPTAPPCLPSSVSGSYVNSAYDRSGVGMVSFSNTCPASASSTSFTANLTGLVSPFNAAGTQVGLFIIPRCQWRASGPAVTAPPETNAASAAIIRPHAPPAAPFPGKAFRPASRAPSGANP